MPADPKARRIPLPVLVTPIVALVVAGYVADALGPTLVTNHPLLQIFLNPRNRYLLLAAPRLDALSFFVVGFVRLVMADPIFFVLGRQYGDAALRWAERQFGDADTVRRLERIFRRAAPVVIIVAPNGYLCMLAGVTGMRLRTFVLCNVSGTVARLSIFWGFRHLFHDELESVLDFIQRYQWPLVALSVVVVTIQATLARRRGTLESPAEIEAEIEAETAAGEQPLGDEG